MFFKIILQKKVTISFDDKVYAKFQKYCAENDIMLSKRIERLILDHLNNANKSIGSNHA